MQTANSALTRNITGDTLVSVQVKGRDVFGMMKILPGVMDSHTSRDYAQWNSGRYLSINGGNSLNKNTTIDGVPVGEEGGNGTTHITPNIDSIGEVNVITSGYNAEHGRQSSGLVSITTKSGTNQFRGSGWYNMRRDEWNKNDFFREQSGSAKPFFEVNIGGYSIGGPVIIPKLIDSRTSEKKVYFFLSQEFTEDIRPTDVFRTNMPTALERTGDFSQTYMGKATLNADGSITGPGANNLQPIIDPLTLTAVPRQRDPAEPDQPGRSERHQPAEPAEQRSRPNDERVQQLERWARHDASAHPDRISSRVATSCGARTPGSARARCSTGTTASRTTSYSPARPRPTTCSRATSSPAR